MEKKLAGLQRRLAKSREGGKRQFPEKLRNEVVATAHAWRAAGGSRAELIRRLGLNATTLDWWMRRDREKPSRVRAVELIEAEENSEEVLVAFLGCGVTVEGLTIDDVIALARGLE